jgi:hypothetical protein
MEPLANEATPGLRLPERGRRVRLITIFYGILVFFWFSPEDDSILTVTILGTGLALLLVVRSILSKFGGKRIPIHWVVPGIGLSGALIGLGGSVLTALLMLLKNARHSHLFPDYPPEVMLATLERAPVWALAGAMTGLGLGLAWLALRQADQPE